MNTDLRKKVLSGEIVSWSGLEINSVLYDCSLDSGDVCTILDYLLTNRGAFNLFDTSMKHGSQMDSYFEDWYLILKVLKMNGMWIFHDKSEAFEFKGVEYLKMLDERNPRYLLKFFLGKFRGRDAAFGSYKNSYYGLLLEIIERTKLRAKVNPLFGKFVERLENTCVEENTIDIFNR